MLSLSYIESWLSHQQTSSSKQQYELQDLVSKCSELEAQKAALAEELSEARAGILALRDRESTLLSEKESLSNQILEQSKVQNVRTTASASSRASDVCMGVVHPRHVS